jgi:tetratricopeptide (TPR) repeat protein
MLETYLKPVLSKHRGLALGVWGEAGIGKSHTVASLLNKLPCQRLSLHATTPFASFLTQLTRPKKLPLWAEKTLEKAQQGEKVENVNLVSAVGVALSGLAPFVLHLEDIHEASAERLEFLKDLAQTLQKLKGVGLLVTSRQELVEPFRAVKLEPLTKEASDRLLEGELSTSLPKEALEFIYGRAAGNPLFTLEYVRFLARQGYLWNDGRAWHWRKPEQERMPVVVEALLEEIIRQAKRVPVQGYVLESKALLPLGATDALWAKVARVSAEELTITSNVLTRQGVFSGATFAHPLFKEVTLQTLSPERKRNLSRRAIYALEDDPVQAAFFVEEAELDDDKNLALLKRAAQKTDDRLQASGFLAKAVDFAIGEEKGQLALEVARQFVDINVKQAHDFASIAARFSQTYHQATMLKTELLAEQGHVEEAVKLLGGLGLNSLDKTRQCIRMYALAGQKDKVYQLVQSTPELLEEKDSFTIKHYIHALLLKGLRVEAEVLIRKNLDSENLGAVDRAGLLQLQALLVGAHGDSRGMAALLAEALSLLENTNNLGLKYTLLFNRGMALLDIDQYDECKRCFQEARETSLNLGDNLSAAGVQSYLAQLLYMEGQYEKAEQLLIENIDYLQSAEISQELKFTCEHLAELYNNWLPLHGKASALKYAHRALEYSNHLGQKIGKADSLVVLAKVELLSNNVDKALHIAKEATAIYEEYQPEAKYQSVCVEAVILKTLNDETANETLQLAKAQIHQFGSKYQAQCFELELDRLDNNSERAKQRMQWFEECGLLNGVNIAKRYFPELLVVENSPVIPVMEDAVRLNVLGVTQLRKKGKQENVKGQKRQAFFALLLEGKISGRTEVSRLELLSTLYADEDELNAVSSLKGLVKVLRATFGANAILTTASGYALGDIETDAEMFLKTRDTRLWRGVYLEGLTVEGQDTVRETLYALLFEKAKELLETNPKEAARVGKILLESDPYNQDYLNLCLQALRVSSNHRSLTRLYADSRKKLAEVGEMLPESWQMFLSA